ncbi:MAG TPA: hypothetical protein GXX15_05810 [Clostridia bacterium]|nr:hypothetical protein [Clostridia bacterium]
MSKSQKFFKGKLYKSMRGNFFEEEVYENESNKKLKGKSNLSSLLNGENLSEPVEEEEENYENE